MQNHKLFAGIFAPCVQSIEEYFTVHFLTVDDSTSLTGDCHPRHATFGTLKCEVTISQKTNDLFGSASTDQNFLSLLIINSLHQKVTVTGPDFHLILHHVQLFDYNFRRKNVTTFNQLRCRNIDKNLTINCGVIHPWFVDSQGVFWCCSEEVTTVRFCSKVFSRTEEVTLHRVVCFIKVNCVYFDVCINNTMQRMISGKDDAIFTHTPCSVSEDVNLLGICSREVMSFTTVNVHHMRICRGDNLQKLTAKLLCKENTRSNNNSGVTTLRLLNVCSILNHTHRFATTSGNNNLSLRISLHPFKDTNLVRTELH